MLSHTLLVVADYLDPEHPGGSARVAWETARALAARGHSVRLVAGLGVPADPRTEGGFTARWFPYPARGGFFPTRTLRLAVDLRGAVHDVLAGARPAAVIAHQPLTAWLARRLRELHGVPLVYVFHSPWHREYELNAGFGLPGADGALGPLTRMRVRAGSRLRRVLEGRVVRGAARVLTLSDFMAREAAAAHGIDPARTERIPGGVDLKRFSPAPPDARLRRELGLPAEGLLLLTTRRLVPRMGLAALVGAFAAVAAEFPRAHLALCGTGPIEADLRRLVAGRGLAARITLCGHVPEERLPDVVRLADLFVVPSTALEGFGLSMLEALACGIPVLATPVGGMVEVLGSLDGRCLAHGTDEASLAAGLRLLLHDPRLRADLGRRGAEFAAARYGWDKAAERLEAVTLSLACPLRGPL